MKKLLTLVLGLTLCLAFLAGCGNAETPENPDPEDGEEVNDGEVPTDGLTVTVAATPAPHAEILEVAKEILAEQNINLEIVEYTDYIQPNMVTDSGQVDANFFQHVEYLNNFNTENGLNLVNAAVIHYEPFGLFAGKTKSIDELAEGAMIAVPNDSTNEARALLLLEAEGIIKLAEGVGFDATVLDIVENPLNLEITEMEAAQLPRSLDSVDMAVINGNYAIQAGLDATKDAIALESTESDAAETYANILAVKAGNEENEGIKALIEALQSEKVRDFINTKYNGAVVPLF